MTSMLHSSPAAGIGLRSPHVRQVLDERPAVPWLEIHSENYYVDGGPALATLDRIRPDYPLSLHGVGMSLGSTDPLDRAHLAKLARLIERTEPALVSEHLCWSGVGGRALNDLLPLPYTEEALAHVCARVAEVQDFLGRTILVENVSSYLAFADATIPEWEFVAARRAPHRLQAPVRRQQHLRQRDEPRLRCRRVSCGDAVARRSPRSTSPASRRPPTCLIDTHGAPVAPPVWALYRRAIARFGPVPTLIEWDTDIPPLATLLAEAATAQPILETPDALAA